MGHTCGLKQLLMLDVDDSCDESEDFQPELHHMQFGECAFYGTTARQTVHIMKVQGIVQDQYVTIIILDLGSTHNFMDSKLLKQWGHQAHVTKPFEVMMADGGKVKSSGCCKAMGLNVGGYNCDVDLYSLPLGGCDIVLGVQWLSTVWKLCQGFNGFGSS